MAYGSPSGLGSFLTSQEYLVIPNPHWGAFSRYLWVSCGLACCTENWALRTVLHTIPQTSLFERLTLDWDAAKTLFPFYRDPCKRDVNPVDMVLERVEFSGPSQSRFARIRSGSSLRCRLQAQGPQITAMQA